jgi:hypothetical protein
VYENTYAFFMQMRDGKVVDMVRELPAVAALRARCDDTRLAEMEAEADAYRQARPRR